MNSESSDQENPREIFIFDRSPEGRVLLDTDENAIPPADARDKFADILEASGPVARVWPCDMWGTAHPGAELSGYRFASRRELPSICGMETFRRSGAAYQMMNLSIKNKFCGVCGSRMADHKTDRARSCPSCGNTVYPALSDAVIVAVERGGRLLLGHNINFPNGRYSVLAGFVDPGETPEEAVAREILEESGVTVKNIRYFGSQSWPFPNSMMLGFNAEWESGEPNADGGELSDVRWFTPDEMPDLPPPISISRQLIDDWLRRVSGASPT
jgi:NAD+ diphosphatase